MFISCLVPEFTTTQEGIDPYFCTADPDGDAGEDSRQKWASGRRVDSLEARRGTHLSALFATLYISEVFGIMTQTLKITCFAVENEEQKDPEEDTAAYFHVSEEDTIILDPSVDSDAEAEESVMVVLDPDFWGMEVEGLLWLVNNFEGWHCSKF